MALHQPEQREWWVIEEKHPETKEQKCHEELRAKAMSLSRDTSFTASIRSLAVPLTQSRIDEWKRRQQEYAELQQEVFRMQEEEELRRASSDLPPRQLTISPHTPQSSQALPHSTPSSGHSDQSRPSVSGFSNRSERSDLPPLPSPAKQDEKEEVTRPQANEAPNAEADGLFDSLEVDEMAREMKQEAKKVKKAERRFEAEAEAKRLAEEARREQEEATRKREVASLKEEVERWKKAAIRREEVARQREQMARQMEDKARQTEEKARQTQEEARQTEEKARQTQEEARRTEEKVRRMEMVRQTEEMARQTEEMARQKEEERGTKENWTQGTAAPPILTISPVPRRRSNNIAMPIATSASRSPQLLQSRTAARVPEPVSVQESGIVATDRIGTISRMNWPAVFHTQRLPSRRNVQLASGRVSNQQMARFNDARGRVIHSVKSVIGKAIDITHEALTIGADLLDYAPIPGLAPVAHTLLDIWDAFELVQSSRFASIRLVERCASILLSVREEVDSAGHAVIEELKHPIKRLHESFAEVLDLLRNQLDMPFLKRFLGRDQMLQDIEHCDTSLTEALWRLGFSIQIRTLKLIQASEIKGLNILGAWKQRLTSKSKVRDSIEELRHRQNLEDREQDFAELRQLLRAAVETTDDVEMVGILQIGRDEMPEAMRALEHTLNNYHPPRTAEQANDDIDRKFMQNGIEALRRLTSHQGTRINLPSWTISRFEINFDRRVGVGLFSNVYKGSWRNRVVAIKMLSDATPRKLFVREAEIWKSLSHPHIVQLLGASSTSSEPPWFFVSPYYRNGNLVKYLKDLPTLKDRSALRMMHEISAGMVHLHRHGVLHGDLKAVNVLMDDGRHCVITDFGQSELKSEVYRVTRQPISRGTLRWQAPELMRGATSLTQEMDVYAFAITCVEIITKGSLPWLMQDDADVRHAVLVRRERPSLSSSSFSVDKRLTGMLHACWHQDPSSRPPFDRISSGLGNLSHALNGRVA